MGNKECRKKIDLNIHDKLKKIAIKLGGMSKKPKSLAECEVVGMCKDMLGVTPTIFDGRSFDKYYYLMSLKQLQKLSAWDKKNPYGLLTTLEDRHQAGSDDSGTGEINAMRMYLSMLDLMNYLDTPWRPIFGVVTGIFDISGIYRCYSLNIVCTTESGWLLYDPVSKVYRKIDSENEKINTIII